MATEDDNPNTPSSNTGGQDIPQTQASALTSTTLASTATAPSYAPIYATAQSSDMTVVPTTIDAASDPTATAAPPQASISSTSPPPPQPGAVPLPDTTIESTPQQLQDEPQHSPPAPAPAPKTGVAPTPAPEPTPALQPQPPIITAAPTFPPASIPTTQTSTNTTTSNINPSPNPAPRTTGSYSYQPGSVSGYNYVSRSGYSYNASPTPTQPQHPNSTTTLYASVYSPPAATGSTTLPFHNTTGAGASIESGTDAYADSESGLWGSTKSWLQSAGNKLAEVEAEVWRRINDAHDK